MKFRLLALGLALASQWPSAHAESFLEVVGASAQRSTLASTAILDAGTDLLVGGLRLNLDPGQAAFISYTYMGQESTRAHQFLGPDAMSLIDSRASLGTRITTRVSSGLLDFGFGSGGRVESSGVSNHAWRDNHIGIVLDTGRRSGWLLLEDGQGLRGPDLDYDDMVMRFELNVAPVPEPGTTALMFGGLALLGAALGRRRAARTPAPAASM